MVYRNLDPIILSVARNYEFSCDWKRAMEYGLEVFYEEFEDYWNINEHNTILNEAMNLWEAWTLDASKCRI